MASIRDDIRRKGVLVGDGAWGTSLAARGLEAGQCPERWNLERPGDVLDIARSYVEAGSDLIMTNSFGGSRFKLAYFGLAKRAAAINEAAAALTRKAAGPDRHVLASIGPTGKFLMTGEVTEDDLYEAFAEQAVALESGGADACVVETMTALDEACTAVRAAAENTSLEIACTFTFDRIGEGQYRTMMGVSPEETVPPTTAAGAVIVGSNCGHGPENMVNIVAALRSAAGDVPILVQANAGLPVQVNGVDTFPATPELMASYVPEFIRKGANIIGGCCGTTPEHIRAIAAAVRAAQE